MSSFPAVREDDPLAEPARVDVRRRARRARSARPHRIRGLIVRALYTKACGVLGGGRRITRRRRPQFARRSGSFSGPEFSRPPRLCPWGSPSSSGIAFAESETSSIAFCASRSRGSPHRARCRAAAPAVLRRRPFVLAEGRAPRPSPLGDLELLGRGDRRHHRLAFSARAPRGFDSSISSSRVFPCI